jgi:periplasmic protein TonB
MENVVKKPAKGLHGAGGFLLTGNARSSFIDAGSEQHSAGGPQARASPGRNVFGFLDFENASGLIAAHAPIPVGPAPAGYALQPETPLAAVRAQSAKFYPAVVAAVTLHLVIVALFILRPLPRHSLGMENGLKEALNVSVISAADLDRLHSARLQPDSNPAPEPPSEIPVPREMLPLPQRPAPPTEEAKAAAQQSKQVTPQSQFDPSAYINAASQQFSAQLNHAFSAMEAKRAAQAEKRVSISSGRVRSLRPGATHVGKSDEFEREVIWALGATVPLGNGKWGSTIVTFTVSAAGQPDGLRLVKTSGDDWLDGAAMLAVRQARLPNPPPGLPTGDRTFVIEYISLPTRR